MVIVNLPIYLAGGVLLYLAARVDLVFLRQLYTLLGYAFIGLNTLITGIILLGAFLSNNRARRLESSGIHGTAKVLKIEETGTYLNDQPQLRMKLEIKLPGRTPYHVIKKSVIPITAIPQLQAGSTIEIIADKENPESGKGIVLILK